MLNLIVLGLIGFFGAAIARMLLPALQSLESFPVMVAGLAGAILGGLFSWYVWPAVDESHHYSSYLIAMLGTALGVGGCSYYMQRTNT